MKRAFSILVGAALLTVISPLSVAHAAQSDADIVEKCVIGAQGKGHLGSQCIGSIADPCIDRAKDKSVEEANACAARELAVWTARLAAALKTSGKSGFAEASSKIAASQRLWSGSNGKLCPVFDSLDPGASLGGSKYCLLQETATRSLLVERYVEAAQEH